MDLLDFICISYVIRYNKRDTDKVREEFKAYYRTVDDLKYFVGIVFSNDKRSLRRYHGFSFIGCKRLVAF